MGTHELRGCSVMTAYLSSKSLESIHQLINLSAQFVLYTLCVEQLVEQHKQTDDVRLKNEGVQTFLLFYEKNYSSILRLNSSSYLTKDNI